MPRPASDPPPQRKAPAARPKTATAPPPLAERILFEDRHVLIVNKACGEISQGDKTGDPSMLDDLKALIKERDGKPGQVFLGLVNRLDRPTSGITIFAKTSKALSRLNEAFRVREIGKTYRAIVIGSPEQGPVVLVHYLSRNSTQNKSYAHQSPGEGRSEARLSYRTLGRGDRYSLIEIELLTGRHHQIRAQLAAVGLQIKGDLKYGAPRSNPNGGISLHSYALKLEHPVGGAPIDLIAPVDQVQSDPVWHIAEAPTGRS